MPISKVCRHPHDGNVEPDSLGSQDVAVRASRSCSGFSALAGLRRLASKSGRAYAAKVFDRAACCKHSVAGCRIIFDGVRRSLLTPECVRLERIEQTVCILLLRDRTCDDEVLLWGSVYRQYGTVAPSLNRSEQFHASASCFPIRLKSILLPSDPRVEGGRLRRRRDALDSVSVC